MYDPIKVVSDFAAAGRGMPDRINKIFRIYTKSSMLLDFSRGAQGVSPSRRHRPCVLACSLVPLGRVRASRPVSTRPRRPCPLLLRYKVSFQRDNGITDSMLPCGSEIMACRDWRSMVLSGLQGHRTDQPGRNEGLVFGFFVLGDVCPSAALLRRELRIADQAVWPAIDDFDL